MIEIDNDDVLINDIPLKNYLKKMYQNSERKEIEDCRKESENIPLRKKVYNKFNSKYKNGEVIFYSRRQIMDKQLDEIIKECGNIRVFDTVLAHLLKGKNQNKIEITEDLFNTNNIKFVSNVAVSTALRKLMRTRLSEYIQISGSPKNRYFQYKGHEKNFNKVLDIINNWHGKKIQLDNDPVIDKKDNNELTISELINNCISKGLSFEIKIEKTK